jgi:hypothetical protein
MRAARSDAKGNKGRNGKANGDSSFSGYRAWRTGIYSRI